MSRHITYTGGYKYWLKFDALFQTGISLPLKPVSTEFLHMTASGELVILKGYAWDGPSGPTIDTKNFMRPSLVHDALYQLMRLGLVNQSYRKEVDILLRNMCKADGMSSFRAWYVYHSVRKFGAKAASTKNKKPTHIAP